MGYKRRHNDDDDHDGECNINNKSRNQLSLGEDNVGFVTLKLPSLLANEEQVEGGILTPAFGQCYNRQYW